MIFINDFWQIRDEPEIASFALQKRTRGGWVVKGFFSTREALEAAVSERCGHVNPSAAEAIAALPSVTEAR